MSNDSLAKSPRLGAGQLSGRRGSFNPYGEAASSNLGLGLAVSASSTGIPGQQRSLSPAPYAGRVPSSHKRTSSEPVQDRRSSAYLRGALRDGIERIWNAASPRLASVAEFSREGPGSPKRTFYRDEPTYKGTLPTHLANRTPTGFLPTIRNVVLRPFYVLFRRGPVLPLVVFVLFVYLMGGFSSSIPEEDELSSPYDYPVFDSYNETRVTDGRMGRIMAAADDYIPQRARNFIPAKWARAPTVVLQRRPEPVGQEDPLWLPRKRRFEEGAKWQAQARALPAVDSPDERDLKKPLQARKPRRDGRALIIEGEEHPIPRLMRRGKKRWEALKAKQSKTFSQAVKEYVKRYGRRPPKGFDKWYAFAKANDLKMIDEFDLIERDLHVFRALTPESLRNRVEYMRENIDWTWGIRIEKGVLSREGQLADHDRARGVRDLVKRFLHEVPDMLMWYNGHDIARVMIPWEEKDRLEQLVENGKFEVDRVDLMPQAKGPFPHWGMAQLCSPDSAVRDPSFEYGEASREWTGMEMPPLPEDEFGGKVLGTVLDSFKSYMDICNSPQYRHYHTASSYVYPHHPTPLLPLFTPGVQGNFPDIHSLIVEQFDFEAPHDPTWDERPFDRVVWRGQTSGPQWDKYAPWISSHRSRLHLLSHAETGSREITLALPLPDDPDLTPRQKLVQSKKRKREFAQQVEAPNYRLNPLFLDTGMVGPAVQCIKEDGTCDEMFKVFSGYETRLSFDRSNLYKYVLDIDGNSWSGRFRRLMASHAVVLKATLYTEFWTDWAMPWVHFIPIQIDYSDLWDVMAFFRGGLRGEGAHDDLAREIALAGREWAQNYFRWEDLETYQFRLMLEYGRLWNQNGNDMDFTAEDDDLLVEPVWQDAPTRAQDPVEADLRA